MSVKIEAVKHTKIPSYGIARDGYTIDSGAPTHIMFRLEGEKRWRRLMCWQISNTSTCFYKSKGKNIVVSDCDIPDK